MCNVIIIVNETALVLISGTSSMIDSENLVNCVPSNFATLQVLLFEII